MIVVTATVTIRSEAEELAMLNNFGFRHGFTLMIDRRIIRDRSCLIFQPALITPQSFRLGTGCSGVEVSRSWFETGMSFFQTATISTKTTIFLFKGRTFLFKPKTPEVLQTLEVCCAVIAAFCGRSLDLY